MTAGAVRVNLILSRTFGSRVRLPANSLKKSCSGFEGFPGDPGTVSKAVSQSMTGNSVVKRFWCLCVLVAKSSAPLVRLRRTKLPLRETHVFSLLKAA